MSLDTITLVRCPACGVDWPEDRYNGKHPECFKCRVSGLNVSFGPAGKAFWHNVTTKMWNERQIKEAKANGMDIVPAHTAANPVSATALRKLETPSTPKVKDAV